MTQLLLAVFGLAALFMATGDNPTAQQWACVVGLAGQPFWLMYAHKSKAWGLMVLSLAYTVVYLRGVILQFWS